MGQIKPKQIDTQIEGKSEQRIQTEIKNQYQFIRLNKRLVESNNNDTQKCQKDKKRDSAAPRGKNQEMMDAFKETGKMVGCA